MVAITFAEAGEFDAANKELGIELKHENEEEAARLLPGYKVKAAHEHETVNK